MPPQNSAKRRTLGALALGLLVGCGACQRPAQTVTRVPKPVASTPKSAPSICDDLWQRAWAFEQDQASGQQASRAKTRQLAKSANRCEDTGRVAFAMGQALLWGRSAQGRGLSGLSAFRRAESWAAKAYARDPEFMNGMPRRVLGSMWALGGEHLKDADSEQGLELLTDQVNRYPKAPENALRLVQALLALGDLESGQEVYCAYAKLPNAWLSLSAELLQLKTQFHQTFVDEGLACSPEPAST